MPFEHHAIVDLDRSEVIHFAKDDGKKCVVKSEPLKKYKEDFGGWRMVSVVSAENADKVLQRARSKVGKAEYNVVFNNCEHFANWCMEDGSNSVQVNCAIVYAGVTGVGRGAAAGTAGTAAGGTAATAAGSTAAAGGTGAAAGGTGAAAGTAGTAAGGTAAAGTAGTAAGGTAAAGTAGTAAGSTAAAGGTGAAAGGTGAAAGTAGTAAGGTAAAGTAGTAAGGTAAAGTAGTAAGSTAAAGGTGAAASGTGAAAGTAGTAAGGSVAAGPTGTAAAGIALLCVAAAVGMSYMWIQWAKGRVQSRQSITVENLSQVPITVTLKTVAYFDAFHNSVHWFRSKVGVGKIRAEIPPGGMDELCPPCEDWFEDFILIVTQIQPL